MHTYNLQGNTILYAYLHLCFSILYILRVGLPYCGTICEKVCRPYKLTTVRLVGPQT